MSDELTQLRKQNRELSEKLDRQIAAWNGGTDALTAHAARQAQRIAELQATVARLETDNRRLRHLDAMPYWSIVQVANDPQLWSWSAIQEIKAWIDTLDGAA